MRNLKYTKITLILTFAITTGVFLSAGLAYAESVPFDSIKPLEPGKPQMKRPYGHDKSIYRMKNGRGRPIRIPRRHIPGPRFH
jgi:hypothetical protein